MKLSPKQDKLLKDYLHKILLYRETYQEVYDHMVSALEERSSAETFETMVNDIICKDFGGHQNLVKMEQNCKRAIVKDLRKKQWTYFTMFFRFPYLLIVAVFSAAIYLTLTRVLLSTHTLRWIFWAMALLPYLLVPLRYFYTGYFFGETKRSIRDNMMLNLSMLPMRVFCAAGALYVLIGLYGTAFYPGAIFTAIGVTAYTVYFLAYVKLSKDEFAIKMID